MIGLPLLKLPIIWSDKVQISKSMLRQYLVTVAVNLGLMNQDVASALNAYDRRTFERLLRARIQQLQDESASETAFFPPEYYSGGVESITQVLDNLDHILASAA